MMRIEVKAFADQAPPQPISAEFDEMSGSIGRSDGNTLILPDPKRYISRTQASVTFRAGSFVLRDYGSATPTLVDGAALGSGNEVVLRGGEEIRIGHYVLAVSIGSAAASSNAPDADPFADLLPPARVDQGQPQRPVPPPQRAHDPFDDLFAMPPAPGGAPAAAASSVIPQDFDPFADLLPTPGAAAPSQPLSGFQAGSPLNQNVDELFALKTPANWDPLGSTDPLGALHDQHSGGLSSDPLAGFAASPQQRAPAQRDDAPMLSGAFRPPKARQERAEPQPAIPLVAPPGAQPPAKANPIVL